MSATGVAKANGDQTPRAENDFYRTPAWAVDQILPHLYQPEAGSRADGAPTWIDAGCGDGAIAQRLLARWPNSTGIGVELDECRAQSARLLPMQVFCTDFIAPEPLLLSRVDLVIGNPPFSQALEFLKRALMLGREVAFLLRSGFLEAKRGSERDMFLEEHRPDVYLLAKRPRFTGDGGDSATYIWAVWRHDSGKSFVRLRAPEVKRKPSKRKPKRQRVAEVVVTSGTEVGG